MRNASAMPRTIIFWPERMLFGGSLLPLLSHPISARSTLSVRPVPRRIRVSYYRGMVRPTIIYRRSRRRQPLFRMVRRILGALFGMVLCSCLSSHTTDDHSTVSRDEIQQTLQSAVRDDADDLIRAIEDWNVCLCRSRALRRHSRLVSVEICARHSHQHSVVHHGWWSQSTERVLLLRDDDASKICSLDGDVHGRFAVGDLSRGRTDRHRDISQSGWRYSGTVWQTRACRTRKRTAYVP